MFCNACREWLTARLYRRAVGRSWSNGTGKRTATVAMRRKDNAGRICMDDELLCTVPLGLADKPLVFIRPSCTVFSSVCTHFCSKCLSRSGASRANWQIDCDKYEWKVRRWNNYLISFIMLDFVGVWTIGRNTNVHYNQRKLTFVLLSSSTLSPQIARTQTVFVTRGFEGRYVPHVATCAEVQNTDSFSVTVHVNKQVQSIST